MARTLFVTAAIPSTLSVADAMPISTMACDVLVDTDTSAGTVITGVQYPPDTACVAVALFPLVSMAKLMKSHSFLSLKGSAPFSIPAERIRMVCTKNK